MQKRRKNKDTEEYPTSYDAAGDVAPPQAALCDPQPTRCGRTGGGKCRKASRRRVATTGRAHSYTVGIPAGRAGC
ncbi:hypothetical protein MRX96_042980 [Rhipicephalus microplus]